LLLYGIGGSAALKALPLISPARLWSKSRFNEIGFVLFLRGGRIFRRRTCTAIEKPKFLSPLTGVRQLTEEIQLVGID
jgi:hypothetical protein